MDGWASEQMDSWTDKQTRWTDIKTDYQMGPKDVEQIHNLKLTLYRDGIGLQPGGFGHEQPHRNPSLCCLLFPGKNFIIFKVYL